MMEDFDKQMYASLLIKGNLSDAIQYVEGFADQDELLED